MKHKIIEVENPFFVTLFPIITIGLLRLFEWISKETLDNKLIFITVAFGCFISLINIRLKIREVNKNG